MKYLKWNKNGGFKKNFIIKNQIKKLEDEIINLYLYEQSNFKERCKRHTYIIFISNIINTKKL